MEYCSKGSRRILVCLTIFVICSVPLFTLLEHIQISNCLGNEEPMQTKSSKTIRNWTGINHTTKEKFGTKKSSSLPSLVIVSGTSRNHFMVLLDLLPSIVQNLMTPPPPNETRVLYDVDSVELILYNLGSLTDNMLTALLNTHPFVQVRTFNYSAYPPFFNINASKGEYAWKPVIIEEVALEYRYTNSLLYWIDAGLIVKKPYLSDDMQWIRRQGIFTPASSGYLRYWTQPGTAQYLGLDNDTYTDPRTRIGSAGIVGFDIRNKTIVDKVIRPWADCARHRECIAPKGSSRKNHRQDQSALSVILVKNDIFIPKGTKNIVRGLGRRL